MHDDAPLRIIAFGAHPDDCEILAGGTAALWTAQGHQVKFVATTNGDIGHFRTAGGPLALQRRAEAEAGARLLGIETEVLDNHDGELLPTLESRRLIARLIREWQADIVLTHRPNDYHPDHRYTSILVQDAAYMVSVPFYTPLSPPVRHNPVFLYFADTFQKPYPFEPTIAVDIDAAADQKWACLAAMPSQFAEFLPWMDGTLEEAPEDEEARRSWSVRNWKAHSADVAERYRERLTTLYGAERARAIRYAEAFELCEYGRQPSLDALQRLFPTFG